MNTSLFELFKIGIGPSSSHTVGPMRAALRFVREIGANGALDYTAAVRVELFGSLAHTGIGHGTDRAILLGLSGEAPDAVDPAQIASKLNQIRSTGVLLLGGAHAIGFREPDHLIFRRDRMYPPGAQSKISHPNGMSFSASDSTGKVLHEQVFYSVGGGFVVSAAELESDPQEKSSPSRSVPYSFSSAAQLLAIAEVNTLTIAQLVLANECALLESDLASESPGGIQRPGIGPSTNPTASSMKIAESRANSTAPATSTPTAEHIRASILTIWRAMQDCIERGIATEGILPGGLNVHRRAPSLFQRIRALDAGPKPRDPLAPFDWVSLFAIAVNEENAAGGRVVTAPTNGAAGVIPAIARYYMQFADSDKSSVAKEEGLIRFFLTAAAIGILYKENASISGAEVGCQGEVGVACSMAAGGLVAALNGSNTQVEHAAEIAMEHNLGMTCDPIGGLVQIPCIERNAMGAVKAINACRMAMHETEGHKLSLDQVIETMYRTGLDMQSRYKETSLAGLALNVIEC